MDEHIKEQVDEELKAVNTDIAFRPIECTVEDIKAQLDSGYMTAGVCGPEFLYIYDAGDSSELWLHELFAEGAGRQSLPKGAEADATLKNLCGEAEIFIAVRYQAGMRLMDVMQRTEEILISSNPQKYTPLIEEYLRANPEVAEELRRQADESGQEQK